MINEFYRKTIGKQGKVYSAVRYLLRLYNNIIFPMEIMMSKKQTLSKGEQVIVSLTSFPLRIDKVWMVVETMFRQTIRPDKIVLTLSELQFKEKKIPKKLLEQTQRGLEIIWTNDDLRSHKKYYYVMQKYPNAIVITVDDDILYEKNLIRKLLDFNQTYPNCILCNWGSIKAGKEYSKWKNLLFEFRAPSYSTLQIGVGGVLYPVGSLYKDVFRKEIFLNICPLADDIWLNTMALLNNTKIVKTDYQYYYIPILYKDNFELNKINIGENQNNVQINKLLKRYESLLENKFYI
jgi:hypothetical protein